MKTEFIPGNEELEYLFESILKMYKEIFFLDAMFYKHNLNAFSAFCESFTYNMKDYCKNYAEALDKFLNDNFTDGTSSVSQNMPYSTEVDSITENLAESINTNSTFISEDVDENTLSSSVKEKLEEVIETNAPNIIEATDEITGSTAAEAVSASSSAAADNLETENTATENSQIIEDALTGMAAPENIDIISSIENIQKSIILPASEHNISSYRTQGSIASPQFQAVMKLDSRLNEEKLKRAVSLSLDKEQILRSRLVEGNQPYWKSLDSIDGIVFCSIEETDNYDAAIKRFIQNPLDTDKDLNVKVRVIRSGQYDILCIKLNHICCDGTGLNDYIALLSSLYSGIDQENSNESTNNTDKLFENTSAALTKSHIIPNTSKAVWPFPWIKKEDSSVNYELIRFSDGNLSLMNKYAKSREATVNDLILTAFYRALFKISKPIYGIPLDIYSALDLRCYLPYERNQTVNNMSGGYVTKIKRITNEPFEATLARVVNETKKITIRLKAATDNLCENREGSFYTCFNDYFELIQQTSGVSGKSIPYVGNECFPILSYLGDISHSLIKFGRNVVDDAYIIPPAIQAPGFMLLASSYNDKLAMSIGHSKASINQDDMKDLLNRIKRELLKSCINAD